MSWVRGSVALLGDASHPTLPYQAQGAAMAVEDGLVLGVLLGRLVQCLELRHDCAKQAALHEVLSLYERLRKSRTAVSVRGAISMQDFFHLADGEEQARRDQILRDYNQSRTWPPDCKWNWGDATYQQSLLGFDVVKHAEEEFDLWRKGRW
jgi:salicylate hydroxylase